MEPHEHGRTLDPVRFLRTLCVAAWLSVAGAAWSAAKAHSSDLVGVASLLIGLTALFAAPVAARMAWRDAARRRPIVLLAAGAMAAGAAVAALFAFSRLPR
jgi:hypothetical protein